MRRLALTLLLLAGCAGDADDRPSADDCAQLRDHIVELRLAAAGMSSGHLPAADLEQHRRALRDSVGSDYISNCRSHRSRADLGCQMSATDVDALRACSQNQENRP